MPNLYDVENPSGGALAGMNAAGQGFGAMGSARSRVETASSGVGGDAAKLANAVLGVYGAYKDRKDEQALTEYTKQMEADPEWRPDMNNSDFNVKAYNTAHSNQIRKLLTSEQVKKVRFETWKNESDKARVIATEHYKKAKAFTDEGDFASSLPLWEKAYESDNDGFDIQFSKDNKGYTVKDNRTGEIAPEKRFDSTRDMVASFDTRAQSLLSSPEAFAKNHIRNSLELAEFNASRVAAGEEVFDKKGNRAVRITGMLDPKTGKSKGVVYDVGGQWLTEEQAGDRGFRTLGSKKTEAEIEKIGSETTENLAQAEAAGITANAAADKAAVEKKGAKKLEIEAYMSAYKLSEADALSMIRQDETNKTAFSGISKYLENHTVKTPEQIKKFLAYKDNLLAGAGLVTESTKPKGKGVGMQEVKAGEQTPEQKIAVKYPPAKYSGKKATINGVEYKSDGTNWVKVGA